MKHLVVVICVLAPFAVAAKKQMPQVVIEVIESRSTVLVQTQSAKTSQSSINCQSMARATETGIRAADSGANCTTTTDAPPPTVIRISVVQVNSIMPDGKRITLVCQQRRRGCSSLMAGSYEAEIDGDSAWVSIHGVDGAKARKVKYQLTSESVKP